jgi:hypothetical protein
MHSPVSDDDTPATRVAKRAARVAFLHARAQGMDIATSRLVADQAYSARRREWLVEAMHLARD